MPNSFQDRLSTQKPLLADGATGTNLFAMGLEAGEAPELWNQSEPNKVLALYKGAVDAGSDIFLTNSFGANSARLALHNAQDQAYDLSARAAELARNAANDCTRDVYIAGSIGPTGSLMGEIGTLSHDDAVEIFYETARGLIEGGADVLWVETISAPEEVKAAHDAIEQLKAPWCATMSFDSAGRTMMGVTSEAYAQITNEMPHAPLAVGANCGVGASDLLRTILGMKHSKAPLIAKGNAGIPKFVEGHIHYDGTPELMAKYTELALRSGAQIVGGCCGTTPKHLEKMRAAMDGFEGGTVPDLSEIEAHLGAFSSADDGLGSGESDKASAGRKRRSARKKRS